MPAPPERTPWVIVAGGFHHRGGMDRANAALAAYLLESGTPVHLVGHEIGQRLDPIQANTGVDPVENLETDDDLFQRREPTAVGNAANRNVG